MDGDLPEGLRLALEAEKVAQRYGTKATVRWTRGLLIGLWFELGNWDKCAPAADEFLAESAALGSHYQDTWIRCFRSWMRLARGDTEAALQDQRESLIAAGRPARSTWAVSTRRPLTVFLPPRSWAVVTTRGGGSQPGAILPGTLPPKP